MTRTPAKGKGARRRQGETPLLSVTAKDLVIQTFSAGGPGGQHQNRRATGVRIIHPDSGARGESREHRSQHQNKRAALKRMADTAASRFWVSQESKRIMGEESIEQWVDRQMSDPESITVEVKDEQGKWTQVPWDHLDTATRKDKR